MGDGKPHGTPKEMHTSTEAEFLRFRQRSDHRGESLYEVLACGTCGSPSCRSAARTHSKQKGIRETATSDDMMSFVAGQVPQRHVHIVAIFGTANRADTNQPQHRAKRAMDDVKTHPALQVTGTLQAGDAVFLNLFSDADCSWLLTAIKHG